MPRGITQDQVNAAIDTLVAAGERPTIERVRVKLGTGSPNTLTRMLEVWWSQLHERLTRQQARLSIPEAPGEVAVAATRLWQLALEHAGAQAGQALVAQREALAADQAALASEREAGRQQLGAAALAASRASQAQAAAEGRLADLQRLLEQQAAQLVDVQGRLDSALHADTVLTERLEASQQALLVARAEATRDRGVLEASHRAAEDRWMQEVDRARRDEAKTAARLQQAETAALAAAKIAASELAKLQAQQRTLEQEAARKEARIATLGEQLERLHQRLEKALVHRPEPERGRGQAKTARKKPAKAS